MGKYPKFASVKILVPKYNVSFKPWEEWDSSSRPDWWTGYNKIKHQRDVNFEKANLKNALHSVGGLFSLLLYFGVEKCGNFHDFKVDAFETPQLMTTEPKSDLFSDSGIFTYYDLPDF